MKKLLQVIDNFNLFTMFSSLTKLTRIVALCIRFFNNLKKKRVNKSLTFGPLTVSELEIANSILIKLVQLECFNDELHLLNKGILLNKKHKLSSLAPFADDKGVLRVGGRLRNTYLSYNVKHPVLLPSGHIFTKLLFRHEHNIMMHAGPQLLLAAVRQFYWPIGGRNMSKEIVKECVPLHAFHQCQICLTIDLNLIFHL